MTLTVTPLYAGLIGLLFIYLSLRVIKVRRGAKISHGDGGDGALAKRIRVQGNCAEYAPFALLLLALAELQGAPLWLVHVLGLMILAGRVIHAYGLGSSPQIMNFRVGGMLLTLIMIVCTSLLNIGMALF